MFDNNFVKCGPIFTILSPVDSWENSLWLLLETILLALQLSDYNV